MTDAIIRWLRMRASRGDYASMARFAQALYDRGLTPEEVLLECYEVDFPEEFFAVAGERLANTHLLVTYTNQPWKLGVPPSKGGPPPSATDLTDGVERRIFARDTDLVPLMQLMGSGITSRSPVICYRLTALQEGSTAVFGIARTAAPRDEIVRVGDSLLAVLETHHNERLRHMEWTMRQPWNEGFGAEDERAVIEVASLLERVEKLRRDLLSSPNSTE